MEKAKFYSQCNFEKWLNYLIWNLIIPVSLPQKIIINLGYVEWKFATPIVKSLVKALKKSYSGKCQVNLSERVTTCFTCNVFTIGALDIMVIAATKTPETNIPTLISFSDIGKMPVS